MSLIVEDGGGLSDANTYVSLAYADGYHALRGNAAWAAAGQSARESALVRATDHLDRAFRWRGERRSAEQALAWPRDGAAGDDGRLLNNVPAALRRACAELALRALAADLAPDRPRDGRVQSESVGPVSTTWAPGAPGGTRRPAIEGSLRECVRGGHDLARA